MTINSAERLRAPDTQKRTTGPVAETMGWEHETIALLLAAAQFSFVDIDQWNNHIQHKSIFIITENIQTCYYLSDINVHCVQNLLYFGPDS